MHSVSKIRIDLFTEIHCELCKYIALSDAIKYSLKHLTPSGLHYKSVSKNNVTFLYISLFYYTITKFAVIL